MRHRLTCSLVLTIHLMSECRSTEIECHRKIIRLLLVKYLEHNIKEPIYRIGMKSLRVGKLGNPIKCTVQNTVSIYQN